MYSTLPQTSLDPASGIPSASSVTVSSSTTAASPSGTILVDVGYFLDPIEDTVHLGFTPNHVSASIGDLVVFNMMGLSHSVTQSSLDSPCESAGLFDTDLQTNTQGILNLTLRYYTVLTIDPLWFYCKAPFHCQSGMVFAINPESDQQMEEFKSNALKASVTASTVASVTDSTMQATSGSSTPQYVRDLLLSAPSMSQGSSGLPVEALRGGWNASTMQGNITSHAVASPASLTATTTSSAFTLQTGQGSGSRGMLSEQALSFVNLVGIAAVYLL